MIRNHSWGPTRLNHGSAQCRHCYCTYEEARATERLGGMHCDKAPPLPPPVSNTTKGLLFGNLQAVTNLLILKEQGRIL